MTLRKLLLTLVAFLGVLNYCFAQPPVQKLRTMAEGGNADAQANLGVAYANGEGVPQDGAEAHKWFNLAASKSTGEDQKKFAELRDTIAAKMTPQQIAEAQRLAREWKPSK